MTIDLASLGWDGAFAAAFARYDHEGHRPARVSRVDRGVCTALAADGPVRVSLSGGLLAAAAADSRTLPCAGDWVVVRRWPDERLTMEAVLPRRTAIIRHAAGKAALGQVLAANLDAVAVVEPVDPSPDLGRIERLLALAWESGARPVLVLTKADLAADPEAIAEQMPSGVDVFPISARTGAGLDPLRALIGYGKTLGLLGQSGAGKSSMVNALAGASVMGTQALRADGRGRHTTTYRALVPLPAGGAVLDTPGVRLVGMFDTSEGLGQAFADLTELSTQCRFHDCSHRDEPGCAVRAALEDGRLTARRLTSWRRLQQEQARTALRRMKRQDRERRRAARP